MNDSRLLLFSVVLLASHLPAQPIVSVDHLIGWVQPRGPGAGQLVMRPADSCTQPQLLCSSLQSATLPFGGGLAYDPRTQAVWVSNGGTIHRQSLRPSSACKLDCEFEPALTNPGAAISGLAVNDRLRRLYHLETQLGYMGIVVYDARQCPPQRIFGCAVTLPAAASAGGLAFDETRDLLYAAVSGSGTRDIFVFDAANPCQVICHPDLQTCIGLGGPLTGLAYDACDQFLYVTDGSNTLPIYVASVGPTGCVMLPGICCGEKLTGDYRGLAVVPGWKLSIAGQACAVPPCPSCPGLAPATAGGDPSLGNGDFAIDLIDATPGTQAYMALALGACTSGTPLLCGSFFPDATSALFGVVGPFPVTGAGSCNGRARVPLGIPADPVLCGQAFCVQWLVLCSTPGTTGFALSTALEFTIATS